MINSKKYELSQQANEILSNALKMRIPFFRETREDDNPLFVTQTDLFGNGDICFGIGGERLYIGQNKSRNDNQEDICIECRSYRGKTVNPDTNKTIPIAGAYWYPTGTCWLAPRWGIIDTFSVYLPGPDFVGHYNRYFLEIMFSRDETWETMTGIHKMKNDSDTFILFFNYREFTNLYLKTVAEVTCGDDANIIMQNKK